MAIHRLRFCCAVLSTLFDVLCVLCTRRGELSCASTPGGSLLECPLADEDAHQRGHVLGEQASSNFLSNLTQMT